MPRIKSKIITSMPMSLRETPARKRHASSEERAKDKATVKARLFSRTKLSQGGRDLLLGKNKNTTPSTSEVEEEEEVEEVEFQTESDGEYVSEDSDWVGENLEIQDERCIWARNPC